MRKEWFGLGLELDLPRPQSELIQANNDSDIDCLTHFLAMWQSMTCNNVEISNVSFLNKEEFFQENALVKKQNVDKSKQTNQLEIMLLLHL